MVLQRGTHWDDDMLETCFTGPLSQTSEDRRSKAASSHAICHSSRNHAKRTRNNSGVMALHGLHQRAVVTFREIRSRTVPSERNRSGVSKYSVAVTQQHVELRKQLPSPANELPRHRIVKDELWPLRTEGFPGPLLKFGVRTRSHDFHRTTITSTENVPYFPASPMRRALIGFRNDEASR